jgi:hypothetical protein
MAAITVGQFTIEGNELTGPARYMEECDFALLDRIDAGQDTTFNHTAHLSPSAELAVLVRLQTDYAAWLGQRELLRRIG